MSNLLSRKRLVFITVIALMIVTAGLYTTYAINSYVEEGTPTTYDMALEFDLSDTLDMEVTIPAGKTKVFDIDIKNNYNDAVKYGVAYEMISPTTLPDGVTIAQNKSTKNTAEGNISANSTVTVSITVINESDTNVTLSFNVINGYKNGGDLIIPSGKNVVTGYHNFGPPTASEKIIDLSGGTSWSANASGVYTINTTLSDGSIATDYRYIGPNVNNYVSFNNDLYRIIGVFDDNTHGVEGQRLIKLISANKIFSTAWGVYNTSNTSGTYSSYKNDWTGNTTGKIANLNVLLNEFFYGKPYDYTSSTYGTCGTWTYFYYGTNYRTNDCVNIIGYGIDSTYRNYIQEATWYLYGYTNDGLTVSNFYLCERGQYSGCTSGNSGAYSKSTTAPIGLMYVSDYKYASSAYASTTINPTIDYSGKNNWLNKGYEWTITPINDDAKNVFVVGSRGVISYYSSYYGLAVRPTFYLKSEIYITGGNGSFDNPYTLSM